MNSRLQLLRYIKWRMEHLKEDLKRAKWKVNSGDKKYAHHILTIRARLSEMGVMERSVLYPGSNFKLMADYEKGKAVHAKKRKDFINRSHNRNYPSVKDGEKE